MNSVIREVGIIGKGKMGRDIFNEFLQYDYKLVMICRKPEDIEEITASVEKQLKKMLKRGYLSEAEYERKINSFTVNTDFSALKTCDMVIESVYEDKELKKSIMKQIEDIVSSDCILASNTSSIPLQMVFEKCIKKDRCLGTHFFYPVKVMKTVEINRASFTRDEYVQAAHQVLRSIGKSTLELFEGANMVLTKILCVMTTHAYRIYEENCLTLEQIDGILKENLLTLGLFEIVDSTGIGIILESIENFMSDRYRSLFMPLYNKGKKAIEAGFPGGTGNMGLAAYEEEQHVERKTLNGEEALHYRNYVLLSVQSILIAEIEYIVQTQGVDRCKLNEAVKEVLGLSEDIDAMLNRIGRENINENLLNFYNKYKDKIYESMGGII
ncbi:MAG: 3-hydroxyacyl-CoA dehydrogenase family protein [Clostridia bacterium]|nr:3-hydroxyacyl-CoA dehydrogenase family protein [Clostridia bacterium]